MGDTIVSQFIIIEVIHLKTQINICFVGKIIITTYGGTGVLCEVGTQLTSRYSIVRFNGITQDHIAWSRSCGSRSRENVVLPG